MTCRHFSHIAFAFAFAALVLVSPAQALQVKAIEFSGLNELQILNVRSELSLAQTQLDPNTVISENRLDYLMRLAHRGRAVS